MFGIVLSALTSVLTWLVRSVLIKFVFFFGLFFVTTEFMKVIDPALLPNIVAVDGALASLPASMAYFMDLFKVYTGLSMVLSALATRFIIRRIPIIG